MRAQDVHEGQRLVDPHGYIAFVVEVKPETITLRRLCFAGDSDFYIDVRRHPKAFEGDGWKPC
jgi:hypothetical protein